MSSWGGREGVVVALEPRHTAQARCSCGWVGHSRVLSAWAKVDALKHAASCGCAPGLPLSRRDAAVPLTSSGLLTVECPAGCGASFRVPIEITDYLSVAADDGNEPYFTAVAPWLPDAVLRHLKTCAAAASWLGESVLRPHP